MKTALSIAGSDSSGGAGIQADLKTMAAHKVFGMTVITALTAQNTLGVTAIHTPPPQFVRQQMDAVFSDIFPDAVKIGMLANDGIIQAVAQGLEEYHAQNIVLDPVMISTSNHRLLEDSAQEALIRLLLPMATLITPNLPEATALSGMEGIASREDMMAAAEKIASLTPAAILVKGGHLSGCADDLLYEAPGKYRWFSAQRVDTDNTHGTGCTLSSAIASNLALGCSLELAVANAKDYITRALMHDPHLGHGNGPLNHTFA